MPSILGVSPERIIPPSRSAVTRERCGKISMGRGGNGKYLDADFHLPDNRDD